MCGRFGLTRQEWDLAGEFSEMNPTFEVRQLELRYNIAPTQPVLTVRVDDGQVGVGELRWGHRDPRWRRPAAQLDQRAGRNRAGGSFASCSTGAGCWSRQAGSTSGGAKPAAVASLC